MPEHNFTLVISGPVDEHLDELFEAGCDDALFGETDGVQYGEFDRDAPTLREAIVSAMHQVEAVDGLRVARVEPEDLVTAAEIAERLGRTRESVRLLIAGRRGAGDFPPPISHLRDRNRALAVGGGRGWAGKLDDERYADAVFVAALNAALEWRRSRDHLRERERELVAELVS